MALLDRLPPCWRTPFSDFIADKPKVELAMRALRPILDQQNRNKARFYPDKDEAFAAFKAIHFNNVKVVIIGHEPYSKKYATGLAFSAPENETMPVSAARIYCAIATNLSGKIPIHGNLNHLAGQGVLLLNRILTIHANANQNKIARKNWFTFTNAIVQMLSDRSTRPLYFMLWGNEARRIRTQIINNNPDRQHRIYEAYHPSAAILKYSDGFRVNQQFYEVNDALDRDAIEWFNLTPPPPPACNICPADVG